MATRRQTLGETGDLAAPPGSREWAIAVRSKLVSALHDAEFSADNAKDWFEGMRRHEGWKTLEGRNGKPFKSFEAFCTEPQPFGLGYKVDHVERIIRERQEKKAAERLEALDGKTINTGNNPNPNRSDDIVISRPTGLGNSADYLTARIKRDQPEIAERMKAGEFSSVRQAALEAGIVKPTFTCPIDPERAANLILKHFELKNVKTLIQLLNSGISNRKT